MVIPPHKKLTIHLSRFKTLGWVIRGGHVTLIMYSMHIKKLCKERKFKGILTFQGWQQSVRSLKVHSSRGLEGICRTDAECLIVSMKETLHLWVTDHWSLWINSRARDEEQDRCVLQGTDGALEGPQRPRRDRREPVKSKWTAPRPRWHGQHSPQFPPRSQPCELPQRAALNSAVHIVHTVHESGGPR